MQIIPPTSNILWTTDIFITLHLFTPYTRKGNETQKSGFNPFHEIIPAWKNAKELDKMYPVSKSHILIVLYYVLYVYVSF